MIDNLKKIVIWSPTGLDTSELSFGLAREISKRERALIAELPCLGIPRLAFAAQAIERNKNIEEEIMELEQKGTITLKHLYKKSDSLAVLPVDIYAFPDYPVTQKVKIQTLISFPAHLLNKARELGYSSVIYDCQGQITTPMTYFAVEVADKVLIPVQAMADISFALLNVKRLVQVFKFDLAKFTILASLKVIETIKEISVIRSDEGRIIGKLDVREENCQEIIKALFEESCFEDMIVKKKRLRSSISSFLARHKKKDQVRTKEASEKMTINL